MSGTACATFPTLDLQSLTECGPDRKARLDELRQIAHHFGAFSLVGHGIDTLTIDTLLATSRRLFALPEAQLEQISMIHSPHFRGYNRVGNERTRGRADWREQIDIGPDVSPHVLSTGDAPYWLLNGPNLWPSDLPEFQAVMVAWMARVELVAKRLLGAFAESLGLSIDYFANAFAPDPHTHLKVVRYPGGIDGGDHQGVGAHKDYGFLTLLMQDDAGGLQFLQDGQFVDVPPQRDAFVVNIGEMLEVATSGYLIATTHRVLSPPSEVERISVPYFYNPRLDFVVERIPLAPEFAARDGFTDPENPIFAEYGRNELKGWLRAHPTVARHHHPTLV